MQRNGQHRHISSQDRQAAAVAVEAGLARLKRQRAAGDDPAVLTPSDLKARVLSKRLSSAK